MAKKKNYSRFIFVLILVNCLLFGNQIFGQQINNIPYPIIFVHGIVGDAVSTWQGKNENDGILDYLKAAGMTDGGILNVCLNKTRSSSPLDETKKEHDDDVYLFKGGNINGDFYRVNFNVHPNGSTGDNAGDHLVSNVSWTDTLIEVLTPSKYKSGDILRIEDEFMVVKSKFAAWINVRRGCFHSQEMDHYSDFLKLEFNVWNLSLESNQASIVKQGRGLKQAINEVKNLTNASKVILVGHSMGGLAIREYLQSSYYQNDVVRVVTIGTPHGGSNGWVDLANLYKLFKNGTQIDARSDAVRDLRYSYDNVPGTYLFSGNELDIPDDFKYYTKDIDCNGSTGDNITGISEWDEDMQYLRTPTSKSLPTNVRYTWITSKYFTLGGVFEGDKVVELKRQWLYDIDKSSGYIKPIPFDVSDTLLTDKFHTNEPEDVSTILRGLDEPDNYSLAYTVKTNQEYIGTITKNEQYDITHPNPIDIDVYKFSLSAPADIQVNVYGSLSGVQQISIENSNKVTIKDSVIDSFPFSFQYHNASAGSYFLKLKGTATANTCFNPYKYIIKVTPIITTTDFDVDVTLGPAPLSVNFHDKSSGNITSWEWDFNNDGVVDSYEQNPAYTYYVPGIYSVKLIVSDGTTSTPIIKPNLITVTEDVVNTKLALAEYFFDVDPGFGNAKKINVAAVSDYMIDKKLDLSELTNGIHILGFRVKDENGKWSLTFNKMFIKEELGINEIKNLVQGEYFFDDDPGFGKGKSINFTQSADIFLTLQLELKDLSDGIHTLMVRFKDNFGRWSQNYNKLFLKEKFSSNDNVVITKLEYYIDQDPGYDLATSVPLISAANIEKDFSVDLSNSPNGLHTIFLRAKDNRNAWSHVYSKTFLKESFSTTKTLRRLEYYIDNDPGYGNGILLGNVSSEKDSVSVIADLKNISTGIHIFNCRAQDSENKWSLLYSKMFLVDNNSQSKSITALEYYFDEDPGYGKGNKIIVNPAGDVEIQFNADIKMLTVAKHNLFIRVKDSNGVWSFVNGQEFEKIVDIISARIKLMTGWNMVSIPLILDDMSVSSIFPNAVSKLFQFNNGYVESSAFSQGKGYWLKFEQGFSKDLGGQSVASKKIQLQQGWNLIGIFENIIPVSKIKTEPADNIQSLFFEYKNGYIVSDTLKPGNAYWVKAKQVGNIDSTSTEGVSRMLAKAIDLTDKELVQINVTDNQYRRMNLYLTNKTIELADYILPPSPPTGIYDVRWGTDCFVEKIKPSGTDLLINYAEYPVTIYVSGKDVRLKDKIGGRLVNALVKNGEKFVITNRAIEALELCALEIPSSYELSQNYPNPFNPRTVIRFGLPEKTNVSLTVYNILGQKVQDIIEGEKEAGNYQIEWDATNFGSGVYFYRLQTSNYNSVKKMLLIK